MIYLMYGTVDVSAPPRSIRPNVARAASGTSTWSVQVPARAFGPTCGEASMEYRTRPSSPDDTSSMSRAEGRRWLAATGCGQGL